MNSASRILFTSLSIALIFSITACSNKTKEEAKGAGRPKGLTAEAYVVTPQSFSEEYVASGTLLPNEEIDILPEISGRVTGIFFTEGAHVRKGQKLIQLSNADIIAQIQKLKTQKDLQLKIKDRQAELVNIGGISKQDYETTLSQVQSIEADIAYQEALLRKTSILAPFDGVVGIRNISTGAVISPTTVVTKLQQINPLRIDFMLPDRYRDRIQNGKEVFFSIGESLDTLSGNIKTIEPTADVNTRNIRVQATIANNNKLVAGSFAHVIIPFNTNNDALLIPSQAIIPTTREKKAAVLRNGKAQLVTIILGSRTTSQVEVLQGLQAGDTILTTGIMQVKPGMEVTLSKIIN